MEVGPPKPMSSSDSRARGRRRGGAKTNRPERRDLARRWFTETVSSTAISMMPNETVTNESAAEI